MHRLFMLRNAAVVCAVFLASSCGPKTGLSTPLNRKLPHGTDATITILEDAPPRIFTASDFGFVPSSDGASETPSSQTPSSQTLTSLQIVTVPSAGTLTDSGSAVSAGQTVTAADLAAGPLAYAAPPNFNGLVSIAFKVQDASVVNTVTVAVTSVNDAPSGRDLALSITEDTPHLFALSDFSVGDANDSPPNTLAAIVIDSVPGAGALSDEGLAVHEGDTISAVDIAAGKLMFQPAANAFGASYASFTFRVQDDGGTANGGVDLAAASTTVSIAVSSVNDAPTSAAATATIFEDSAGYVFSLSDFAFSDASDTPPDYFVAVTIAFDGIAGVLLDGGTPVHSGQSISVNEIASGALELVPAPNANGTTKLSFQVQDDGGTANGGLDTDTTPRVFTLAITPVNDPPAGSDRMVSTLAGTAFSFSAASFGFSDPADTPANALAFVHLTTLPTAGSLTLNGTAVTAGQAIAASDLGALVFTPNGAAHASPYASFSFQVQDNGGTANGGVDLDSTPNTLTINVTVINSAPDGTDGTVSALEDTAYVFKASDFGLTDTGDSPPNALSAVKVTTVPAQGSLTDDGVAVSARDFVSAAHIAANKVKFLAASNATGAAYTSFTFQVLDDGGFANGGAALDPTPNTLTIDVVAVNDAPHGTPTSALLLEDGAYSFAAADFGFSDSSDSPANNFSAVTIATLPLSGMLTDNGVAVSVGQSVPLSDLSGGVLVFTPVANANGAAYTSFAFEVRDDGGTANGGANQDPTPESFVLDVGSVNDAPGGSDKTVSVTENTPYAFTLAKFGFSDKSDTPANNLAAVKIDSLPALGDFSLSGTPVTVGQVVTASDITNGVLIFTPPANAMGVNYASFSFRVRDDGGTANGGVDTSVAANTLTINVVNANSAPAGSDGTVTALEDVAYTFTVGDFGFSDPDDAAANAFLAVKITTLPAAGVLSDRALPVNDGDVVSVDDISGGFLRFSAASNANGAGYSSLTFQVQDDGGTAAGGVDTDPTPNTLSIDVSPVNDAPAGANATLVTDEDTPYVFSAADFGFSDTSDSPANALLAVKVVTLATHGTLADNGAAVVAGQSVSAADLLAGVVTFTGALNGNGASYAQLTFEVQDNGGTANGGIDRDGSPNTITFNVNPIDDAPAGPFLSTANASNAVHSSAGSVAASTALGVISATDVDTGDTAGFALADGTGSDDNTKFKVVGTQLETALALDANVQSSYSLRLRVTDSFGLTSEAVFTLTLDSAPTDILLSNMSVFENHAASTLVGTLTASDPDSGESFTYALSAACGASLSADNAAFEISGTQLETAVALDHEAQATRVVCLRVSDHGGVTYDKSFSIAVSDINDAPSGADATIIATEDTDYAFSDSSFGFTDSDNPAHNFLALKITTLPGAGTLKNHGVAVSVGQLVPVSDLVAGSLVFRAALNANGNAYASFTFQVRDDGGTANGGVDLDPLANKITLNVAAVEDAPVLASGGGAPTFTEAGGAITVDPGLTLTDVDNTNLTSARVVLDSLPDGSAEKLATTTTGTAITATYSAGTLSLSGSDSAAHYQQVLRNTTYNDTSAAPTSGTRSIAFTVNDGSVDSNTASTALSVVAVNNAPSIASGALTITVNEDTVFTFSGANAISVADADAGSGALTLTLTASNGTLLLTSSSATLTNNGTSSVTANGQLADLNASLVGLKYQGNANFNGSDSFVLTLNDNGNTGTGGAQSATKTYSITVKAVNDVPVAAAKSFAAQANMKTTYSINLASDGTGDVTDPDNGDAGFTSQAFTLTSVVASSCSGCVISNVNATAGTFDFEPPPGKTGAYTLTYKVTDNGNPVPAKQSLAATITLNVAGPVIWFVNGASGSDFNNGELSHPFATISKVASVDLAGDVIFVYSGTYATSPTLKANEKLVGQAAIVAGFDSYFGLTPPPSTVARPALGASRPTIGAVNLGPGGSVVDGFVISVTGNAYSLIGSSTTTGSGATINNVTASGAGGVNLTNASGPFTFTGVSLSNSSASTAYAVALLNASAVVTFDSTSSIASTGAGLLFSNLSGGSSAIFNCPVMLTPGPGQTAVSLASASAVQFAGGLVINATTGTGISASGSAQLEICDDNPCDPAATGSLVNSITTTSGTALALSSTTIGANGLELRSVSSTTSSTNPAISLSDTGTLGRLKITGTGTTAGSGGTIANRTGADSLSGVDTSGNSATAGGTGIFLSQTLSPSFSNMNLHDFSNFAIYGNNVSNVMLTNIAISGANGTNAAADKEEPAVRFDNLLGTATVTGGSIAGGYFGNLGIWNVSGTLTRLTVDGTTFGSIGSSGVANVTMRAYGGASAALTVNNATFNGTKGAFIDAEPNDTATLDLVVRGTTFKNGQAGATRYVALVDSTVGAHTLTFDISHNAMNDTASPSNAVSGSAIAAVLGDGTAKGTVRANDIGPLATISGANAMHLVADNTNSFTVLIDSNTITGDNGEGIALDAKDSATMNATVIGTSEISPQGGSTAGLALVSTASAQMNISVGSASSAAQMNTFAFTSGAGVDFNGTSLSPIALSKSGAPGPTTDSVIATDNNGVSSTSEGITPTLVDTQPPLPPGVAP